MRPHARFLLAILLCATLPFAVATAQQSPPPSQSPTLPVVPGARVRVSAQTLVTPLMANYLEMRGDTAVFIEDAAGRGIWTFTIDQITKLEQSIGERAGDRRYMVQSALIGIPAGALVFWGVTGLIKPSDSTTKFNRGLTAGAGALVGAGVGALVGSRFKTERWMSLPLPNRTSFIPRRRGGFDIGIGFSF